MLLFEHEGKAFLREYGIATPRGVLVRPGTDVEGAWADVSLPVMVKAQVLTGGRGKAGGIRMAGTASDARAHASALDGSTVHGMPVEGVLVEECVDVRQEFYVAVTFDGEAMIVLLSTHGGVDVERFFLDARESFATICVDPLFGISEYQVRKALHRLGVGTRVWPQLGALTSRLVRMFRELDATLVEINPLAELGDGTLMALDARVQVDDGALFRQPRLRAMQAARRRESSIGEQMRALEIQFVPLGGAVGVVSSGAGAGVAIMDWIEREGSRAAGFMDLDYAFMGGKTEEALRLALGYLNRQTAVRSLLVNFTTCGLRLDLIAAALVKVLDELRPELGKPLFIHLQGNRSCVAQAVVREAGYPLYETLGDAVRGASRVAAGAHGS